MKRMISGLTLFCLLTCALIGASTYNDTGSRHFYWVGVVPTSATSIVAGTVYLQHATLASVAGGTFTFLDRGTDCGGSPCKVSPTVTIAANTEYEIDFGSGMIAPSGINVLATGTVDAHIHWVTQMQP